MKLKIKINLLKFFLKNYRLFIKAIKWLHIKCTHRLSHIEISQIKKNFVDPQKSLLRHNCPSFCAKIH